MGRTSDRGCTGFDLEIRSTTSAGIFSNSKVTTSTDRTNVSSKSQSAYDPLNSRSEIWPAGLSGEASKVWTLYPIRRAAIANIRPNCPPPNRPIVEPGGKTISMGFNLKRSSTVAQQKIFRSQNSEVRRQE